MAHNLSYNEATQKHEAFFARESAWHQLGQEVPELVNSAEAIKLAGLDWEVVKRQLTDPLTGKPVGAWGTFRDDNGAFLGAVGDRYQTINNEVQFELMDAIINESDSAYYETAGALGAGEVVWVLARISQFKVCGVDDFQTYLLCTNSHNGTKTLEIRPTTTRVVCQNTLEMATGVRASYSTKFSHTLNGGKRVEEAKRRLALMDTVTMTMRERMEALAVRKVNAVSVADIVGKLLKITDLTAELKPRTARTVESIIQCFETNDDNTFPEFRGTAYNLLNAITEHVDHFSAVRTTKARTNQSVEQMRAENAIFNSGAKLKTEALELILEETANAPRKSLSAAYSFAGANADNAALLASIIE